MSLASGTRLGPYEVLTPLGAGGMGEVYRARDTRLDRTVAIKVLPAHSAADPALRERFEREAHAVSNLNHPHICTLHDVGSQNGVDFLVMEYLEGETLAVRLSRGPLRSEQALRFGVQIADALEKAHRQGIVHRDLKPGNIMLTKSGAKLLDFGLAKLRPTDHAGTVPGSPTLLTHGSTDLTGDGSIVGTLQYMAPEQLEGKNADARSDIFSFGSVLYEMITGKKAFEGKSKASVIVAILERDPAPISAMQPMTPPALDHVVKRCLAKDPDERWQNANDLASELTWIAESWSQAGIPAHAAAPRRNVERLAWLAVSLLLGLAGVALAFALVRRPALSEARPMRFAIQVPDRTSLDVPVALSPDGRRLAFIAAQDGKRSLWIRSLNSLEARSVPNTDGAAFPFWSPDSRFLGFFADGRLKRVDPADGSAQALAIATDARGGSWNRDGTIIFAPATTQPLYRVAALGGEAAPVTTLDESTKQVSHRWPWFLPDGRHFIYLARCRDKENEAIYVGSLDSKDQQRLVSAHSAPVYAAPGYLLINRERRLTAQRFDASHLLLSGDPFTVAQNVELVGENGPSAYAAFSVSDNGLLAYRQHGASQTTQFTWFDRSGNPLETVGPPGFYSEPALSADGKRLAMSRTDQETGSDDIWLMELSRGTLSRFTFDATNEETPVWSPDGSHVVFSSSSAGFWNLLKKPSSGVADKDALLRADTNTWPDDWSRDGRYLIYQHEDPNTQSDLWVLPMTGDRTPRLYLQSKFSEGNAQFSPDGRWVAYGSDESGRSEVYVVSFPNPGSKFQISTDGGDQPAWRGDGKELFYLALDRRLMAVDVGMGATLETGTPHVLFETHLSPTGFTGQRTSYVASADGQRFLVNAFVQEAVAAPITLMLDWTAEMKR